jgi:hypothetical protein
VSQEVINKVVEAKGSLRCTHYDAFRFFHPVAARQNVPQTLTRQAQEHHEQPGCVHATMDLFKYAYELYPLLPATVLLRALQLAVRARRLDIRASPYDTSDEPDMGGGAILIETAAGRAEYAREQEALFLQSSPLRFEILDWYDRALAQGETGVSNERSVGGGP